METVNGCTVIRSSEVSEPIRFGPAETSESYVGDGPVRGLIVISPGDAEHEFVPVEPG